MFPNQVENYIEYVTELLATVILLTEICCFIIIIITILQNLVVHKRNIEQATTDACMVCVYLHFGSGVW